MSHSFHHPNQRHAASFHEVRYCSSNLNRPTHRNRADFRKEEEYYYATKVEAPDRCKAASYTETVYDRPGYRKCCEEKVVDYEFTDTVREEDIVEDEHCECKHHGRFNRLRDL